VFNDPHHESVRAEAIVRLFDSVVSVRRRYQFFVWMQNHLQNLLPHQVAVCGCYQRASRELSFEVFNSVVLTPAATGVLVDPHAPLLRSAMAAWIRSAAQPLVVQLPGSGTEGAHGGMQDLRSAGLLQFLVHGVARPQRPSELETFFLFAYPQREVSPAQSVGIELLMPYLHSLYLRVQSTEKEVGGSEAAGAARPRLARALLTERERQVLIHVREGLSNQQIGEVMGISALTVKNHVQKLLRKLGAANRAQAVAKTSTLADADEIDALQIPVAQAAP